MTEPGNNNDPRALWQNQPQDAVGMSLQEIRAKANRFALKVKIRNTVDYVATGGALVGIPLMLWYAKPSALELVGWFCGLLGALYFIYYVRKYGRAIPVDVSGDVGTNLQSMIREFQRQRDLHLAAFKWYIAPFLPTLAIIFVARLNEWPAKQSIKLVVCVIAIVYTTMWWHKWIARGIQASIDTLERTRKSIQE